MESKQSVLAPAASSVRARLGASVSLVFGLALFSSAFLIFWAEPFIARLLLPRFGGTQSVWNTCLVFFQISLLAGYSYAHGLTRLGSVRRQGIIHLSLLSLGIVFLPLGLPAGWDPGPSETPFIPLFLILATTLGVPFFALSASAPLLQHWFASTNHARAENPYFLYAASNAGSLAALLAYPFLFEPNVGLGAQSELWAILYVALVALVGVSAAVSGSGTAVAQRAEGLAVASPTSWSTRATWLTYSALPSSLLLGVTGFVTTDVASFPLLWILPLALYLLTFIVTFSSQPIFSHDSAIRMIPLAVIVAASAFWLAPVSIALAIAVHFTAFFLIALACHGELARLKPPPAKLTEFYFWLSLGGAVGGILTSLVSPLLFDKIVEYPLALALVCVLRPREGKAFDFRRLGTGVLLAGTLLVLAEPLREYSTAASLGLSALAILAILWFGVKEVRSNPLPLVLTLLVASHIGHSELTNYGTIVWRERSFYGAYSVNEDADGYRTMMHGTTNHGMEVIAETGRPQPIYFAAPQGPLGNIMRLVGPMSRNVAVVGLGIGNAACYSTPGQSWTYYEIDPLVYRLAADSGYFRSLRACAPDAQVILGDGRLKLEAAAPALYDMLLMDAFSSDSIPVHLLTREAFLGYVRALKPGGVLIVNVSNRHFELPPIVAKVAASVGLTAYQWDFVPPPGTDFRLAAPARWMVLAGDPAHLAGLDSRWTQRKAAPETPLWTDDFSNILSALK